MFQGTKSVSTNVKAVTPTDAEWDAIKASMLNPERFKPEDVRVYKSWLANNYLDRSNERFALSILKVFAKTLPGKSVLFNGHEWGPPGSGRWFDAKVVKVTREQVLENIGFTPSKSFLKKLDAIEAQEGLHVLEPKFYTLASNPATENIDAGIMRDMSIGFRADELKAVNDQAGNVMWREYQATNKDQSEALEGSFVFLGDQIGARTKKGLKESQEKGVIYMNVNFKSLGLAVTVDPESESSVKMLQDQVETKVAEMTNQVTQAKKDFTDFKAAIGSAEMTIEQAKQIAVDAKAYREAMVEEAVKFGTASGMIAKEKADDRRKELATMTPEQVKMMLETYKQVWKDRNGAKATLTEPNPEDQQKSATEGEAKVVVTGSEF